MPILCLTPSSPPYPCPPPLPSAFCLSLCLSVRPSVRLPACLPVYPSVCLSVCLSVGRSVRSSLFHLYFSFNSSFPRSRYGDHSVRLTISKRLFFRENRPICYGANFRSLGSKGREKKILSGRVRKSRPRD